MDKHVSTDEEDNEENEESKNVGESGSKYSQCFLFLFFLKN